MKIKYNSEADILLLVLRDEPPVDAIEEPGGVIVSYGEDGEPVSVEFMNASVRRLIRSGEVSVTLQISTRPLKVVIEMRARQLEKLVVISARLDDGSFIQTLCIVHSARNYTRGGKELGAATDHLLY